VTRMTRSTAHIDVEIGDVSCKGALGEASFPLRALRKLWTESPDAEFALLTKRGTLFSTVGFRKLLASSQTMQA
jgi:hypothetical protein